MGIGLQSLGPLTVLSAFPPPPNPMTFILPSIPYPQAGKRQDFISPMPYASYTVSWFTYHIKGVWFVLNTFPLHFQREAAC